MSKITALELAGEIAELGVDKLIETELLKEIPVVGWIVKSYAVTDSVRDKLYGLKVKKFLSAIEEIPKEKRDKFKDSINNNNEDSEKLCEKILMSLDTITDISKADMIANLFISYLDRQIDKDNFKRCVDIVCNNFVDDIHMFSCTGIKHLEYEDIEMRGLASIVNTPLVKEDEKESRESMIRRGDNSEPATSYSNTRLGDTLIHAYRHGSSTRLMARQATDRKDEEKK
jgi:hypothetical protein